MTFAPRTWVVGEVVSAATMNQEIRDQFNTFFGAWTSYTPTWTSSSNPNINNGTLTGRYMKIGRMVFGHVNVTGGSTTTWGSGAYNWSLPATAANAGASFVGTCQILTASNRWQGQLVLSPGATQFAAFSNISATNTRIDFVSGTMPETLASGSQLRMTFMYEAAS
ncbi:hypothetical protein DMH12_04545 [Streptomyces sp. WAC 04229]|uniref:hypothetical protein n=1 Tax=Streptomyces sp. WAC 04229 TaxID=2203206 RepID=UPI000F739968|nr:hypothetical protein [Streptomyces sp. WAC 04229]RSN64045.1 hypothetical protein DMH12_04545 [Streptomyces sp. WAC 04229]